jgi:hypothetical protein
MDYRAVGYVGALSSGRASRSRWAEPALRPQPDGQITPSAADVASLSRPTGAPKRLRGRSNFVSRINVIGLSRSRAKIFHFCFSEICVLFSPSRPTKRGVSRSSRTWGGLRWTRRCRVRMRSQGGQPVSDRESARQTSGIDADVKACGPGTRCWCQVGEGVSAQPGFSYAVNSSTTEAKRIRLRGERAISVKTIRARECRMIPVPPL